MQQLEGLPPVPKSKNLSRREREIMDVLFALGDQATADEIRERLPDPPGYSAVRAMLARLEAKGFIRHRAEGLRYVYTPSMSRTTAQKRAVSQLVRIFFGRVAGRDCGRSPETGGLVGRRAKRTACPD